MTDRRHSIVRMDSEIASNLPKTRVLFLIEVELICCVVLVTDVQQSNIYIYILFHNGLLQEIEYSSLCCIVAPCCLCIL